MEYWRGYMDWPLDPTWVCNICGGRTLIWGLAHGLCRCAFCHVQYAMRVDGKRVEIPASRLKEEYEQPAKWGWAKWQRPTSEWTDEMWDEAFAAIGTETVISEPVV